MTLAHTADWSCVWWSVRPNNRARNASRVFDLCSAQIKAVCEGFSKHEKHCGGERAFLAPIAMSRWLDLAWR